MRKGLYLTILAGAFYFGALAYNLTVGFFLALTPPDVPSELGIMLGCATFYGVAATVLLRLWRPLAQALAWVAAWAIEDGDG